MDVRVKYAILVDGRSGSSRNNRLAGVTGVGRACPYEQPVLCMFLGPGTLATNKAFVPVYGLVTICIRAVVAAALKRMRWKVY